MAKATIETQEQTKLVTVKVPVGVTLNLSIDEAEFLLNVMHKIGGNPDTSPRKHSESICATLSKAGIEEVNLELLEDSFENSIYYAPYK